MRIGLSDSFDSTLYFTSRNQSRLGETVTQLSSGLRINTAADDPSGLAIAESLRSISNGLQQGIANVQTANNALTVADGALETITGILQRVRTLIVEANSDLNSQTNLNEIQVEINQLTLEINRISSNANFNGKVLLDGSLSSTQVVPASFIYKQNPTVNNSTTTTLINASSTNLSPNTEQVEFSFSVDSYDSSTNLLQVTLTAQSPDPNFGPVQAQTLHVTPGTNFFNEYGPGAAPYVYFDQNSNPVFQFDFNTLGTGDVGKEALLVSVPTIPASGGAPLTVNTGTSEGSTVSISIDAANTNALAVNEITVGDTLTNQAAEVRVDYALDAVNQQRAQLGAQIVSLNEAANDASIQYVNQVAAESSIRDLNVGAATTDFAREQILTQVGTSVLFQTEVDTRQLAALLINALVA